MKTNVDNPTTLRELREIVPVVFISPGSSGGWIDWDLSATVGARSVYLEVQMPNGNTVGVRTKGSVINRYGPGPSTYIVKTDVNGFIQYWDSGSGSYYNITGLWS